MMQINRFKIIGLAFVGLLSTACSDNRSETGSSAGTLSVSLTDAPVDSLQSVFITVTGLSVQAADGTRTKIVLPEPRAIDLLSLQNGLTDTLVDGAELAAGDYDWIRLDLSEEVGSLYVVDHLGGQYNLTIPSGAQTGLKLVSGFTILANGQSEFVIDFDLRKSVRLTGDSVSSGDYVLKPTLRLIDNAEAGAIGGMLNTALVQSACANEQLFGGVVYVYAGNKVAADDFDAETAGALVAVPVTDDNGDGTFNYLAAFLPAGDYTVAYTCDTDDMNVDEALEFTAPISVSVKPGASATANF